MEIRRSIGAVAERFKLPTPPQEWCDMHTQVIEGVHPQIPNYGHGEDSQLHYYGRYMGVEKGRLIIPVGYIEHSTHISRGPDGIFTYEPRGPYPRTD